MIKEDEITILYSGTLDRQVNYDISFAREKDEDTGMAYRYGPCNLLSMIDWVAYFVDTRLNTKYEIKIGDPTAKDKMPKEAVAILEKIIKMHNKIVSAKQVLSK